MIKIHVSSRILFKYLQKGIGKRGLGTYRSLFKIIEIQEYLLVDLYSALKVLLLNYDIYPMLTEKAVLDLMKKVEKESIVIQYNLHEASKLKIDFNSAKLMFSPLPHQEGILESFVNTYKSYGNELLPLWAEVGSGKTYLSLYLSEYDKAEKVLIIAPKNTIEEVWIDSLTNELFHTPQDYYLVNNKSKTTYMNEKYILCSYENIDKVYEVINKKEVFLIVDEIHNFAGLKSARSSNLVELLNNINYKRGVVMSGTPIKGIGTSELINMLRITSSAFRRKYKKYHSIYYMCNRLLRDTLVQRYMDSSMLIQLPPRKSTFIDMYIKLPDGNKYKAESIKEDVKKYIKMRLDYFKLNYDKYETIYLTLVDKARRSDTETMYLYIEYMNDIDDIRKAYKKGNLFSVMPLMEKCNKFEKLYIMPVLDSIEKKKFTNAKSVYKYLALKIQGESLANVIGKARMNAHKDMVKYLDLSELIDSSIDSTLIFSKYIEVCEEVNMALDSKLKPALIYGEHTKNANSTIQAFKRGDLNPMVATYQSVGTGNRLTKATTMIMIDVPFTQVGLTQAKARIDRTGQDNPVTFYTLILDTDGEPNINSRNLDIVAINNDAIKTLTGIDLGGIIVNKTQTVDIPVSGFIPDVIVRIDNNSFTMNLDNIYKNTKNALTKIMKGTYVQ